MKTKIQISFIALLSLFIFAACQDTDRHGNPIDNTTSGSVKISVDESLKPLIETEWETFKDLYPKAHLDIRYLPETEAINTFLEDTMRLVITSRELNENEKGYFKSRELPFRETIFAYGAVALISNTQNPDSNISLKQLESILKGQITNWNQLSPKNSNAPINVVFDNANSSTYHFIKEYFKLDSVPSTNFYAMKTNPEVIEYVKKTPNALGIIGVSWIADYKDSVTNRFLKDINVVGITPPDSLGEGNVYYKPYQAFIASRQYPLVTTLRINSRELWAGLGTGFASFVAGDKGQMIVRLFGLMPATVPIRFITVKKEFNP